VEQCVKQIVYQFLNVKNAIIVESHPVLVDKDMLDLAESVFIGATVLLVKINKKILNKKFGREKIKN